MGEVAVRKSRFSESQIVSILKEAENGRKVKDLCREHGISTACFYQWKSKYGGLEASDLKRLRELEDENNRLKKMYADMALEHQAMRYLLGKL
jgi:putative transposase